MTTIIQQIREQSGSLDAPRFFFVRDALAANPYAGIVAQLERCFACENDTDPNDDVSFGYVLRRCCGNGRSVTSRSVPRLS